MATVEDGVFRQETRGRPGMNTRLAAPPQAALNRQVTGPSRLDAVPGLSGIAGLHGAELESALPTRLATRPAAEWVTHLAAVGIGAQPVISITQLMRDPWVAAHGLSVTREHWAGTMITTIGPPASPSRAHRQSPAARSRRRGGDAAGILARIGLADRLENLVGKRVIALA